MNLIESIDPFIMQLVIVPLAVIFLGVLAAGATKKFYIGPIVTLVLALSFNAWYFPHTFPNASVPIAMIFAWCIIFPVFSLFLSWIFVSYANSLKEFLLLITKEKSFYSK